MWHAITSTDLGEHERARPDVEAPRHAQRMAEGGRVALPEPPARRRERALAATSGGPDDRARELGRFRGRARGTSHLSLVDAARPHNHRERPPPSHPPTETPSHALASGGA